MNTKKILLTVCALFLAMPGLALAGSYEGTVQGFQCVTQGKVCPVGKEDPMIAAEQVFVLHIKGDKYFFVPNVDRGIMARHLNEPVKIEGIKSEQFNSIKAKDLYVRHGNQWKKSWSQEMQDEIYYEITSGYPLDGA
jgi:hypothetical protein